MNEHVKVLEQMRASGFDYDFDNEQYAAIDAAIAALNPWQPIETAPKDGTRVLVCGTHWEDRQPIIVEWDPDYELWATPYGVLLGEGLPDVWSPLPPPPAQESTND